MADETARKAADEAKVKAAAQVAVKKAATAEAQAKADAARRAAELTAVPADLHAWLGKLNLAHHGPQLVADHKLFLVTDCRYLEAADLSKSGLSKVRGRRGTDWVWTTDSCLLFLHLSNSPLPGRSRLAAS